MSIALWLVTFLAFVWSMSAIPVQYRATTFVSTQVMTDDFPPGQIDREISAYITLLDVWASRCAEGQDPTACSPAGQVTASNPAAGSVIRIQALGPSPEIAKGLADQNARNLVEFVKANRVQLFGSEAVLDAEIAADAVLPRGTTPQAPFTELVLGALAASIVVIFFLVIDERVSGWKVRRLRERKTQGSKIDGLGVSAAERTRCDSRSQVSEQAHVDESARVWHWAQIREHAFIGASSIIGRGVYIGSGVHIGQNCKIQNYALVYEGSTVGDGVFIGPGAVLTNDRVPRAVLPSGQLKGAADWVLVGVNVGGGASIGAGAICVAPVSIGEWAMVAAGATVVRDVPAFALVAGSPARQVGWVGKRGFRLQASESGANVFICPQSGDSYVVVDGKLEVLDE